MGQRTEIVRIRYTPEEKERLRKRAAKHGLSMSDFIRGNTSAAVPLYAAQDYIKVYQQEQESETAKETKGDAQE